MSEDNAIKIFSLVAEANLKTPAGIYLGTLAVVSSACLVPVSS